VTFSKFDNADFAFAFACNGTHTKPHLMAEEGTSDQTLPGACSSSKDANGRTSAVAVAAAIVVARLCWCVGARDWAAAHTPRGCCGSSRGLLWTLTRPPALAVSITACICKLGLAEVVSCYLSALISCDSPLCCLAITRGTGKLSCKGVSDHSLLQLACRLLWIAERGLI
jgi:hypothetical protein